MGSVSDVDLLLHMNCRTVVVLHIIWDAEGELAAMNL